MNRFIERLKRLWHRIAVHKHYRDTSDEMGNSVLVCVSCGTLWREHPRPWYDIEWQDER